MVNSYKEYKIKCRENTNLLTYYKWDQIPRKSNYYLSIGYTRREPHIFIGQTEQSTANVRKLRDWSLSVCFSDPQLLFNFHLTNFNDIWYDNIRMNKNSWKPSSWRMRKTLPFKIGRGYKETTRTDRDLIYLITSCSMYTGSNVHSNNPNKV